MWSDTDIKGAAEQGLPQLPSAPWGLGFPVRTGAFFVGTATSNALATLADTLSQPPGANAKRMSEVQAQIPPAVLAPAWLASARLLVPGLGGGTWGRPKLRVFCRSATAFDCWRTAWRTAWRKVRRGSWSAAAEESPSPRAGAANSAERHERLGMVLGVV